MKMVLLDLEGYLESWFSPLFIATLLSNFSLVLFNSARYGILWSFGCVQQGQSL